MTCIRLIDDKTGLQASMNSTEQLATSIDPKWAMGTWTLTFACMAYLPPTPELHPGYGTADARWFVFGKGQGNYVITHDQQEIVLSPVGHLVFDHIQIITTAINRVKDKLSHQLQILRILGNTLTLRQAREVFAASLGTTIDKINNSNFKKTHNHLFKEVGAATLDHSGQPPKFCQLN